MEGFRRSTILTSTGAIVSMEFFVKPGKDGVKKLVRRTSKVLAILANKSGGNSPELLNGLLLLNGREKRRTQYLQKNSKSCTKVA